MMRFAERCRWLLRQGLGLALIVATPLWALPTENADLCPEDYIELAKFNREYILETDNSFLVAGIVFHDLKFFNEEVFGTWTLGTQEFGYRYYSLFMSHLYDLIKPHPGLKIERAEIANVKVMDVWIRRVELSYHEFEIEVERVVRDARQLALADAAELFFGENTDAKAREFVARYGPESEIGRLGLIIYPDRRRVSSPLSRDDLQRILDAVRKKFGNVEAWRAQLQKSFGIGIGTSRLDAVAKGKSTKNATSEDQRVRMSNFNDLLLVNYRLNMAEQRLSWLLDDPAHGGPRFLRRLRVALQQPWGSWEDAELAELIEKGGSSRGRAGAEVAADLLDYFVDLNYFDYLPTEYQILAPNIEQEFHEFGATAKSDYVALFGDVVNLSGKGLQEIRRKRAEVDRLITEAVAAIRNRKINDSQATEEMAKFYSQLNAVRSSMLEESNALLVGIETAFRQIVAGEGLATVVYRMGDDMFALIKDPTNSRNVDPKSLMEKLVQNELIAQNIRLATMGMSGQPISIEDARRTVGTSAEALKLAKKLLKKDVVAIYFYPNGREKIATFGEVEPGRGTIAPLAGDELGILRDQLGMSGWRLIPMIP